MTSKREKLIRQARLRELRDRIGGHIMTHECTRDTIPLQLLLAYMRPSGLRDTIEAIQDAILDEYTNPKDIKRLKLLYSAFRTTLNNLTGE